MNGYKLKLRLTQIFSIQMAKSTKVDEEKQVFEDIFFADKKENQFD